MPKPATMPVITAEVRRKSRTLKFVESNGGPLIVVPGEVVADWHGVYNAQGEFIFETEPCDYDRACHYRAPKPFAIAVGKMKALVLPGSMPTAWYPVKDGGLFIRWGGADSAAALLQVALDLPPAKWRATRIHLVIGQKKSLFLFDSAEDGSKMARRKKSALALPAGDYRLAVAGQGLTGSILDGDKLSEYSVEVYWLRRT